MDCLGHYADFTFTVWAAMCRTSACVKRFTWKSLDFHANDITGGIYFHTNSSHKESFCHRGKSKLGIGLFIHELLREPLIIDSKLHTFFHIIHINRQTRYILYLHTHSTVPLSSLLILNIILVQRSNNTRFYIYLIVFILAPFHIVGF